MWAKPCGLLIVGPRRKISCGAAFVEVHKSERIEWSASGSTRSLAETFSCLDVSASVTAFGVILWYRSDSRLDDMGCSCSLLHQDHADRTVVPSIQMITSIWMHIIWDRYKRRWMQSMTVEECMFGHGTANGKLQ